MKVVKIKWWSLDSKSVSFLYDVGWLYYHNYIMVTVVLMTLRNEVKVKLVTIFQNFHLPYLNNQLAIHVESTWIKNLITIVLVFIKYFTLNDILFHLALYSTWDCNMWHFYHASYVIVPWVTQIVLCKSRENYHSD